MARRRLAFHLIALAVGVAILCTGLFVGLQRYNDQAHAQAAGPGKTAKYDRALRFSSEQRPAFRVTYVEVSLEDLKALASGDVAGAHYQIIPTEVGRRIETNRPAIHPDFTKMHPVRDEVFVRALREGRAKEAKVSVVGLLVSQVIPGEATLRLSVDRLDLKTFESVWDPLDLIVFPGAAQSNLAQDFVGTSRSASIAWSPQSANRDAFVPLGLLHVYRFPETAENADLLEATGGLRGWQVTSDVVLCPRSLVVSDGKGQDRKISLGDALTDPLVMDPVLPE